MSRELVLITGISGFVGYATLVLTLESGYRVRGVVRKSSQIDTIKHTLPEKLHPLLEFAVVADVSSENALEKAMEGVNYIMHIASPGPSTSQEWERDYLRPAIDNTVSVLSAANGSPSVKRVIITSSAAALVPIMDFATGDTVQSFIDNDANISIGDDETCHYDLKQDFGVPFLAYTASKTMALDAAEDFMKSKRPGFDLIILLPTFVFGAHYLARTPEEMISSSNGLLLSYLRGKPDRPVTTNTVHIDDVAKLHVQSLDPTIPAGRYLLASGGEAGTDWSEAIPAVKKHFPEAVGTTFVEKADIQALKIGIDDSKAEQTFGVEFKSFEEQVKSSAGYYLSLLSK
ncbi:putative uncharacterized oxidoreductase [Lachnellula suecica]|uniref:Uncharacterized oxidoreductase n=1 Tax=Lachnellula suecica TaxID=602035 RepID=A0A8T9CA11_9HELO|nr:putative uncharacterized oxidoreductase [Lachnellula suecica]